MTFNELVEKYLGKLDFNNMDLYTGIKDNNGCKIYEKDIVCFYGAKRLVKFGEYWCDKRKNFREIIIEIKLKDKNE